jgi:ribosomal protein S6E (S10)
MRRVINERGYEISSDIAEIVVVVVARATE